MEKYYRFAGVELLISMSQELFYHQERRLEPFVAESVTDPERYEFSLVPALTEPGGQMLGKMANMTVRQERGKTIRYIGGEKPYIRVESEGKHHSVQLSMDYYKDRVGTKTVLESIGAEHLVAQNQGYILHCSCIERGGKAILFTAPSETGKSTQAELWKQYRNAQIINGDRAAVRRKDGVLYAEGIPFAGSSQYCENRSLPLEAVVYLGQAPETTIRKMRGYEAFARIWEGVSVNTWDKQDLERVSELVKQTAEQIPVYHLPCTPDESAVMALEQALRKQENQ